MAEFGTQDLYSLSYYQAEERAANELLASGRYDDVILLANDLRDRIRAARRRLERGLLLRLLVGPRIVFRGYARMVLEDADYVFRVLALTAAERRRGRSRSKPALESKATPGLGPRSRLHGLAERVAKDAPSAH